MKRKLQKAVSVLLVFSMLCCVLAFTPIGAGAAETDETVAASTVKTRDEAVAWLRAQEGARYDIDGAYGSQCSDFTSAYVNYVLTGNPYGGRIGVYNANQYSNAGLYPSDWQVIQNTATFVPQPGDIFIVNGADSRYGHTGVVISSTVNTATIADQNGMSDWSLDYGSPAHIHDITWTGSGTWAPTFFVRPCFETWHNPEGTVDVIEGGNGKIHVRGWAFDRDDFGNQIPIHVYIGGRSGDANAEGHSITANTQRTDVNSVYGCGDWHGFDADISTSKRGNQPVYIYALNIGGGNDNPQIGEGTANIKEPTIVANSITINKSTLSLEIGKSETLTATVLPTDATDKTITWTSSNPNVATVSNGKVTAVAAGKASVTAKTTNGKIASCLVTVREINSLKALSVPSINIGDTIDLDKDLDGMTVEIEYSDSSKEIVTYHNNCLSNDKVSYKSGSYSWHGDVYSFSELDPAEMWVEDICLSIDIMKMNIKSISVNKLPNNTEYLTTQGINGHAYAQLEGILIDVTMTNGQTYTCGINDFGYELECSEVDVTKVGRSKVTLTYADKTAEFYVNVVERADDPLDGKIKDIVINQLPSKVFTKSLTLDEINSINYVTNEEQDIIGVRIGENDTVLSLEELWDTYMVNKNMDGTQITVYYVNGTSKVLNFNGEDEGPRYMDERSWYSFGENDNEITVYIDDIGDYQATITIADYVKTFTANHAEENMPSAISLNKTTISLNVSDSEALTATITPSSATNKTVKWTSSNEKIATVSGGKVTAVAAGTAIITATTVNGKTATCQVTVKASVSPDAAQYKMSNATACAGSNVELIVSIENNPGIISMRNQVEYDASALELVGVEDCKLLAGYTNPSPTINSPYSLRWADSLATQNNTANGNLVKLSFRIKEDTSVGDYVVSVKHNEARDTMGTKVEFASADATISVIDFLLGDIDNDGEISDWDAILLNRFLADWPITINEKAADIDKDGEISDWDAITLERYLAGWDIKL